MERRNLAAVANLLTHVAAQEDPNSLNDRFVRVPLQEYIKSEGPILKDWIMDGKPVTIQTPFYVGMGTREEC
jgi:Ras GTPase-activating-like protein IQGAP2/3